MAGSFLFLLFYSVLSRFVVLSIPSKGTDYSIDTSLNSIFTITTECATLGFGHTAVLILKTIGIFFKAASRDLFYAQPKRSVLIFTKAPLI